MLNMYVIKHFQDSFLSSIGTKEERIGLVTIGNNVEKSKGI